MYFEEKKGAPTDRSVGVSVFWRGLLVLAIVLTAGLAGCGSTMSETQNPEQQRELRIKTATAEHLFRVELALDERSQARGLMFRREMPADHGMLFIYEGEKEIAMWMKNTVLSLDMLFVRADGTIVKIARNTEPFSEQIIGSGEPVAGVLELNAGTSERLSIRKGDRVLHPLLSGN